MKLCPLKQWFTLQVNLTSYDEVPNIILQITIVELPEAAFIWLGKHGKGGARGEESKCWLPHQATKLLFNMIQCCEFI